MKLLKPTEGIAKKQKKKVSIQNLDSANLAEESKVEPVSAVSVEPVAAVSVEPEAPAQEEEPVAEKNEPSGSTSSQSVETTYSILDEVSSVQTEDDSIEEYEVNSDWNCDDDNGDLWEQNQWQFDQFFSDRKFSDYSFTHKKLQEEVATEEFRVDAEEEIVDTEDVGVGTEDNEVSMEDAAVGTEEEVIATRDVGVGPESDEPIRIPRRYTITTQTMKLLLREMDPITENYTAERVRVEQELKDSMSQPIVFECEKAQELEKLKKKDIAQRHEEVALTLQKRFSIFLSALEAADGTVTGEI
ncbi:uncharacterized protein LOC114245279 isoform X2 [Bombyx mandarina]|nr:uncharacterized protein LOC114245279 isoform X2 [Bombyx mandarina]